MPPDQDSLYPFEVVVRGTPISIQGSSASKLRWKETVRRAGQDRARETDPLGFLNACPVALTIYYFPLAPLQGDLDNIVKTIIDALIGVTYNDDWLVERIVVQKFEPQIDWAFDDPSDQLSRALDIAVNTAVPIVYIRVDDDLTWRRVR